MLSDVSFEVAQGSIVGFLGRNGAGKTTTLRVLLGLAAPDAGMAAIFGRRYPDLPWPTRRVGAVLDDEGLHPGRSGLGHLRIAARAVAASRRRIAHVLNLVGLRDAAPRRIRTYSFGMRRRLALATALLGDPEVLILDEPANGLDPGGMRWLRELLRRLAAEGRSILVSSHALAEVAQTADRVVILHEGRVRADLPTSGLPEGRSLEDVFMHVTEGAAGAAEYTTALDVLRRFHDVVVCDLPADPTSARAVALLARANRIAVVNTPDRLSADAGTDLLGAVDSRRLVPVVNRGAPTGSAAIAVPDDETLGGAIASGRYSLESVAPPTRLAAARIARAVLSTTRAQTAADPSKMDVST